jgi:hypothetical protein
LEIGEVVLDLNEMTEENPLNVATENDDVFAQREKEEHVETS